MGGGVGYNGPIFFSLGVGSPTLGLIGATPGDILAVNGTFGPVPVVFVSAATLGLPAATNLDSLSLQVAADENGNPVVKVLRFTVDSLSVPFAIGAANVDSGGDILEFDGTSLSYLDGAGSQDLGYDAVKRLVRKRCFLPDGVTAFLDREDSYNRANMRTSERRHDDFGLTDAYAYDSLYRIGKTTLDQDGLAGATVRDKSQIEYTWDAVGNRRGVEHTSASNGAVNEEYAVNAVNEYTNVAGVAQVHDDTGNLIDGGNRTYAYNYRNRLVGIRERDGGAPIAEYRYYADNRRARKIVSEASDTMYFYDRWQVCEEQDGVSGETYVTYVWRPAGIDQLVQFERTAAHPLGAGTFYAHQDARKSVVALTDSGGNVVERTVYDDFGNALQQSAVGNPNGFQGRRFDSETGLYYFRNRFYDPQRGRFLQRDPVWDPGNVGNQYTFVGNGPVSRGDALGLASTRALTSRDENRFIEDDTNIWLYPQTLVQYGRRLYLDLDRKRAPSADVDSTVVEANQDSQSVLLNGWGVGIIEASGDSLAESPVFAGHAGVDLRASFAAFSEVPGTLDFDYSPSTERAGDDTESGFDFEIGSRYSPVATWRPGDVTFPRFAWTVWPLHGQSSRTSEQELGTSWRNPRKTAFRSNSDQTNVTTCLQTSSSSSSSRVARKRTVLSKHYLSAEVVRE